MKLELWLAAGSSTKTAEHSHGTGQEFSIMSTPAAGTHSIRTTGRVPTMGRSTVTTMVRRIRMAVWVFVLQIKHGQKFLLYVCGSIQRLLPGILVLPEMENINKNARQVRSGMQHKAALLGGNECQKHTMAYLIES